MSDQVTDSRIKKGGIEDDAISAAGIGWPGEGREYFHFGDTFGKGRVVDQKGIKFS